MTRRDKSLRPFERFPAEFTWDEPTRLLRSVGYEPVAPGRTSGSQVRFARAGHPLIKLHRPHPGTIVKRYQLCQVHEFLQRQGLLKDVEP